MTEDLTTRIRELTPEQRKSMLDRLRAARAADPAQGLSATMQGPLSTAQERFFFLDQLDPGNPAYNIPVALRIRGELDSQALEAALTALTTRHDALRCAFTQTPQGPRQSVREPDPVHLERIDLRESPRSLDGHVAAHARTRIDLAAGPVLHAALFALGDDDHLLHLVVHHIAFDGWSTALLVADLTELYRAQAAQRPARLDPLPTQYPDFARWERRELGGQRLAGQLARSRDRLAGAPPALNLPTDVPRPPVRTNRGGLLSFEIDATTTARLAGLARQEGTTLYVATLSIFALLLAKASGDQEVMLGTPVAGRLRAQLEPLIGCFANTLVLRTEPGTAGTFRELLRAVHAQVREAFADQEVPYARLVEELAPVRDPARNPLFQVMFGFADLPVGERDEDGVRPSFALESYDTGVTDFELFLSITRRGEVLDAEFAFNADLFHRDTVLDLTGAYQDLLAHLPEDPDAPLRAVPALRHATVGVAATFTADPVEAPLQGWMRYLGLSAGVESAPYGQVHQQLLATDSVLARDPGGAAVLLLRWEDWLRNQDASGDTAAGTLAPLLDRHLTDLCEALAAFRAATGTPLLVVVCPPSQAWRSGPWPAIFAGLQDRLARTCAHLSATRFTAVDGESGAYPVARVHDPAADQLANIPYTSAFFTALGTVVARQLHALCAAEPVTVVLAADRVPRGWPERDTARLRRLIKRQLRYGRRIVVAVEEGSERGRGLTDGLGDGCLLVDATAADLARRPAAALAAALATATGGTGPGTGTTVFLDPDPDVCAQLRAACPTALTLPVPGTPAAALTALEHLWVLDAPAAASVPLRQLFPSRTARVAEGLREVGAIAERVVRRAPAAARAAEEAAYTEPRTPTERRVADLWADLLDRPRVGLTANFFALGGHSFLAVELLSRVRGEFDRDITLYELLADPTVQRLAELVDSAAATAQTTGPVPVPRDGVLPLSPTQRRMWALAQVHEAEPRHNISFAALLEGPLDEPALRAAVGDLLLRHEVLRTAFATRDGEPELLVHPADAAWQHLVFPRTVALGDGPDAGATAARLLAQGAAEAFDLANGPLIRIRLLAESPERHQLLVVMHHAVSDDWSWRLFLQELATRYAARHTAVESQLPELTLQFADYAHWQQRRAAEPDRALLLDRWRSLLAEAPPLLAMPTDKPRPTSRAGHSGRVAHRVDQDLTARLRAVSRHHEVPLFSLLLTAYSLLLARCAEQESLVVGVPAANREADDVRSVMGYFADLLPVRLDVDLDLPLADLVRGVHRCVSASRALQEVPLSDIVDAVRPARVPGHNPLFQAVFNFIEGDDEPPALTGLALTPLELPPTGTDFDLFLSVGTIEGELALSLEYSSELYEPSGAGGLLDVFAALLEALADQPQTTGRRTRWPDGGRLPALRPDPATVEDGEPDRNLLAIAAGFTAEPIAPALRLWSGLFGHRTGTVFAPYAQVFQQLLDPEGTFGEADATANAVLLRWEDWVRHTATQPDGGPDGDVNRLVGALERNLVDLCAAIADHHSRSDTPLLVAVCPASPRWSTPLWAGVRAGLLDRLVRACAGLDRVRVLDVERAARAWTDNGDPHDIHDPEADSLGHLPYTPEFFSVLGTVLARAVLAAGSSRDRVLIDPARLFSLADGDALADDGPWQHDEAVAAALRAKVLATGRQLVLTSADPDAPGLLAARGELLPASASTSWSRAEGDDPLARYTAAIRAQRAEPGRWVVLDPDPELCAAIRAELPDVAALAVPADPERARRTLDHLWLLDGPTTATAPAADPADQPPGTALEAQLRLLERGWTRGEAIHRAATRNRAAGVSQIHVAPRDDRELLLAGIWADLLGLEQVGVHDNFFDLGGDSMTAIQVVTQAARAGVKVTPRQVLEAGTVATLAAAESAQAVTADQAPVTGAVPLTAPQRWFFDQPGARMERPALFNHPYYLTVPQDVGPEVLEQALRCLLDHHDGLRSRFAREPGGQGWTQRVEPLGVDLPFESFDLSGLAPDEREARAEELASAAQRGLDLTAGPLVRAVHLRIGGTEPDRLLIVNHHLVVDAISRGVLLEDLATVCRQLAAGQPPRPPAKSTSYQQWSRRLSGFADSAALRAELPFWLDQSAPAQDRGIPVDFPGGIATFDAGATLTVDLGADRTAGLKRLAGRELRSGLSDLLAAVVAAEVADWTGRRECLLALAGHGRDDVVPGVDLSRTVGWFQIYYPLLLTVPRTDDLGVLRAVQPQLRAVPHNGVGYSALRYLSTDPAVRNRLAAAARPQVSFNFMGEFGFEDTSRHTDLFGACDRPFGRTEDEHGVWPYPIDVVPGVVGRSLRIGVNYNEHIHRRSTVQALAERLVARVDRLLR